MTLESLMENSGIAKYRLAKNSGVPYSTLNDICNGKTQLEKCSAETVYRPAKELGVSMEDLLEPYMVRRVSFEVFKSNVCHRVKEQGDIAFLTEALEQDLIRAYYERKWYPESLYLLAMVDYLSRVNGIPLCEDYDDLRKCRLTETVYPASVLSLSAASGTQEAKERSQQVAIPEFMRFNIVESEVRSVI